jgi:hypothetical protein
LWNLARSRPDDRDIAIDRGRPAVRHADSDCALLAKRINDRAARGIDRNQTIAAHEENPRREFSIAGPVADPAR